MQSLNQSAENYNRSTHDAAYWTGNTATEPVTFDFHLTEPTHREDGIEASFEPHAPVIHATEPEESDEWDVDEAELPDEVLDEFERLMLRDLLTEGARVNA